jgi:PadR family transcriptional regulator PadR
MIPSIKNSTMNIENTQSQMRKGVLEFCILSIIQRGEAYPSDIIEEMKKSNLQLLEGTLYPLLTRLKNADLLNYRWVESSGGPPRKYFSLTEKGSAFYQLLENTWREMADGVERVINSQGRVTRDEGNSRGRGMSDEGQGNSQGRGTSDEGNSEAQGTSNEAQDGESTDNRQPTTDNSQLTTDNPQPASDNPQLTTDN